MEACLQVFIIKDFRLEKLKQECSGYSEPAFVEMKGITKRRLIGRDKILETVPVIVSQQAHELCHSPAPLPHLGIKS